MERTETGRELFPEGTYEFTITEPATKRKTTKGKFYYIFRMSAVVDGEIKKYSEVLMTWMAGDMLRALGCEEVKKDIFEWDKSEIVNRKFRAEVVHEEDFKDKSKLVSKLKNFERGEAASESNGAPPPPEEDGPPHPADAEDIPF